MTWLVLSFITATCWAAVQLVDKTIIDRSAPSTNQYLFISGLAAVPVVLIAPLFLGASPTDATASQIALSIAAGLSYFVANAFFFYSLITLDASIAAATFSVIPAAAAIGAWVLLGQAITFLPAIGLALITAGVLVMNAERRHGDGRRTARLAWIALSIATVLLVAEYLIEGYVVEDAASSTVFYWTRVGVVAGTAFYAIVQFQAAKEALVWITRRSRSVGAFVLGNEALDMIAIAALIAAYASGHVGLATGIGYANPALVYIATIGINAVRPKTIPSEGDVKYRGRRISGVAIVVLGVLLASMEYGA